MNLQSPPSYLLHDGALPRVPGAQEEQLDDLALPLTILTNLPVDPGVRLDLLKVNPARTRPPAAAIPRLGRPEAAQKLGHDVVESWLDALPLRFLKLNHFFLFSGLKSFFF